MAKLNRLISACFFHRRVTSGDSSLKKTMHKGAEFCFSCVFLKNICVLVAKSALGGGVRYMAAAPILHRIAPGLFLDCTT